MREKKRGNQSKLVAKVWSIALIVMAVLSLLYYLVCLVYGGLGLSWGWLWLLIGIYLLFRSLMISRRLKGKNKLRIPKAIGVIYYCLVAVAMIIFIIGESAVIGGMRTEPQPNLDYIIVLGAGVRGTTPTRPLLLRMEKAYEYLSANPNTMVIASGGQGPDEGISEAECIKQYLVSHGIAEERILLEEQSTSTDENIRNSFAMIPDANAKVGILTSGFHIYRALMITEGQGHSNVCGIPARTLLPVGIHYVVREFFAVVKYKLCGA